ncbi:tyrosine-type recombinase/integrase [Paraburkholderia caballeronis]|uniref:Phage integrase family protein n=1 Tax=Paraburkholderia caballeronis TaxID=416943 RepID=A0A1H7SYZ9_9BURK|nr:site-specific integrase [Paraburkholderia caballeronis]PXW25752.1 phage integrase family protein [Paraburkholderia caballeronis]PXX01359.1 phage integrase family protein [Paraburkholderia caballeronis]RAJ99287.1 phage integrase family protein [Paraburkholderia caballeronis]SEL77872.1 Phage integrase family protein [Paraburkholderia caballeronis]
MPGPAETEADPIEARKGIIRKNLIDAAPMVTFRDAAEQFIAEPGHRVGENPARYVDHLDRVLPRTKKRQQVQHHPALASEDVPAFIRDLKHWPRRAARMLHLLILTATRTNEVMFARTEEFDLTAKVWTIPAERMKMKIEHREPLPDDAVKIVREATAKSKGGWLFPGFKEGKPLSNMAMLKPLEILGRTDITVHGIRSTFRDWIADCTDYPDSLAEQALARTVKSQTVRAYRRRDMLERRLEAMFFPSPSRFDDLSHAAWLNGKTIPPKQFGGQFLLRLFDEVSGPAVYLSNGIPRLRSSRIALSRCARALSLSPRRICS